MESRKPKPKMRVIAWETTRRCSYNCIHCRASALNREYSNELSTDEGRKLIDSLSRIKPCILILTGGEPLMRDDIYELASYAVSKQIRVVMATCGSMMKTDAAIQKVIDAGISRISISIDGADAKINDKFRGRSKAFRDAVACAKAAKRCGLEFQINTTVSRINFRTLDRINSLAESLGAAVHDVFLLVPTGRGSEIRELELSKSEYEQTLEWIAEQIIANGKKIKVTCAPHYSRIFREMLNKVKTENIESTPFRGMMPSGCLAGGCFTFVSHRGDLQPCGFFDRKCGNIRDFNYDFDLACCSSEVFQNIADRSLYSGKCRICKYWSVCSGCRARALVHSDNYLAEEPYCSYVPE